MTVQTFMQSFKAKGRPNPLQPSEVIIGNVKVDLKPASNDSNMIKIWTIMSSDGGRGKASDMVEKLKHLAGVHGVNLMLKPAALSILGMDTLQLRQWYMRHGFRPYINGWMIWINHKERNQPYKITEGVMNSIMGAWEKKKKKACKRSSSRVSRVK